MHWLLKSVKTCVVVIVFSGSNEGRKRDNSDSGDNEII